MQCRRQIKPSSSRDSFARYMCHRPSAGQAGQEATAEFWVTCTEATATVAGGTLCLSMPPLPVCIYLYSTIHRASKSSRAHDDRFFFRRRNTAQTRTTSRLLNTEPPLFESHNSLKPNPTSRTTCILSLPNHCFISYSHAADTPVQVPWLTATTN